MSRSLGAYDAHYKSLEGKRVLITGMCNMHQRATCSISVCLVNTMWLFLGPTMRHQTHACMSNYKWLSTGGSSGIGKATALAFSTNGATVTITGVFQTSNPDLYALRPCCSHVCQKAGYTSFKL